MLNEKIGKASKSVLKVLYILLVPIVIDIINFFVVTSLFNIDYVAPQKFFILKLGTISAPPSVQYILDNFQAGIYYLLKSDINYFTIALLLLVTVISSYARSLYMVFIERVDHENINIKECFKFANECWFGYFVLSLIVYILGTLVLINQFYFILAIPAVVLYYVQYSIVVDKCSFINAVTTGIDIFLNNIGFTIKVGLYYGFLISLLSPFIFAISRYGTYGVIICIFIVDYLGMIINKAVLEIYRELRYPREEMV